MSLARAYQPGAIEDNWYSYWHSKGFFTPTIDKNKRPFVVIMPPLNVTGEIHMGHALTLSIEDIIVRWHRMLGEPTLWLPGTDHAGIATQIVIERQLEKQGLSKEDIGRERFLDIAWEWTNQTKDRIYYQNKVLGASCDWTRSRFTLDDMPSKAVRYAFIRLFQKKLIYKGERIINWCPRCQTALSDLEVEHINSDGNLYYIQYPLVDGSGNLTIATTRPETLLGDTAVAVNPQDERFSSLIGKEVILPLVERKIPVIADESVDIEFGTGALKITPAHDPTDFEVGKRHGLPVIDIMNPRGTMNDNAMHYAGLDRYDCRKQIITDLKSKNLLLDIKPYTHSIGHCGRCKTAIEPKISTQWFIKTKALAQKAIDVVISEKINIVPKHFTKVYLDWMENIKDWCISRQLWWGHRIPVWYCNKCGELTVAEEDPIKCQHCNSNDIYQDPDVLDTWFSSALWPHSTLGWPDNTEDLNYFYPTSVMETGYDILFFWVARMIMMGIEDTGSIPFNTVYLHGLIRDEHGDKMSKMKGNVINPIDVINDIGVDALRFGLTVGTSSGNDINLGKDRLESSRNFINKLWNASRFVIQNVETAIEKGFEISDLSAIDSSMTLEDRWIHSRINALSTTVNDLMNNLQIGEAEQRLHDFFWFEYCDWYLEFSKIRLRSLDSFDTTINSLIISLEKILRLLHPFIPFVTEELWQKLTNMLSNKIEFPDSIMISSYPTADNNNVNTKAERSLNAAIEIIRSIRNARVEYGIKVDKRVDAIVYTDDLLDDLQILKDSISYLARLDSLSISTRPDKPERKEKAIMLVLQDTEVLLPWADLIDVKFEKQRLLDEISVLDTQIQRLLAKLSNSEFLNKAPTTVVTKEQDKVTKYSDKKQRLENALNQIERMLV